MKTAVFAATVVSIAATSIMPVHAGDLEGSTAGKVLTGVVAAGFLAEAFRPHYRPPAMVYAPAPVVYAPAPVVYHAAPAPQVVYVAAPPACCAPAPFYRPRHTHVLFGGRW